MTTVPDTDSSTAHAEPAIVALRLEAVVIPVADYDRARAFYTSLGWRVDADADDQAGYRLMQLTPPGSDASVLFGTRVTAAPAGSLDGLLLVVDDIDQARAALIARRRRQRVLPRRQRRPRRRLSPRRRRARTRPGP